MNLLKQRVKEAALSSAKSEHAELRKRYLSEGNYNRATYTRIMSLINKIHQLEYELEYESRDKPL